jgi:hypothetical protein
MRLWEPMKRRALILIAFTALLILALGGWLVRGVRTLQPA